MIEHILGICGEHWHPNIYHVLLLILIITTYFKWQKHKKLG